MKKMNLQWLASRLSEADIDRLLAMKRENPKLAGLKKKRDQIAAELDKLDKDIAALNGKPAAGVKKRGRPAKAAVAPAAKGKRGRPAKAKKAAGKRGNLIGAIKKVLRDAGKPMKTAEIVPLLPEAGFAVENEAAAKNSISRTLATRKTVFNNVAKGLYALK